MVWDADYIGMCYLVISQMQKHNDHDIQHVCYTFVSPLTCQIDGN